MAKPAGARREKLIYGERVYLRQLRRSDIDEIAEWPHFEEPLLQWANVEFRTEGQKELWYRQELYDPTRRRFSIIYKERVVGVIGLRNLNLRVGHATLGLRLSAAEVNKGYGTDAIRALLGYAFDQLGLREVVLDVAAENHRAIRCYEKCGFRHTGQHHDRQGDLFKDMAISADEFAALSK